MERKRALVALAWIGVSLGAIRAQNHARPGDRVALLARPFPLTAVRLLDGPVPRRDAARPADLLDLDRTACSTPSASTRLALHGGAAGRMGGARRGAARPHRGHYLTASALMYAATGDARFKARADAVVAELARIQEALGRRLQPRLPLRVSRGVLRPRGEARKHVWAPYYTLHKIMAGLLDVHQLCGNPQALEVLLKQAAWVRRAWTR